MLRKIKSFTTVLIIAFFFSFNWISCNTDLPNDGIKRGIHAMIDLTPSNKNHCSILPPSEKLIESILGGNKTKSLYDGGSVHMYSINGSKGLYHIGSAELPTASWTAQLEQGKRIKEIEAFETTVQSLIDKTCEMPKGVGQSRIFANLNPFFEEVAASDAEEKIVYLVSDLLENIQAFSIYRIASPTTVHEERNKKRIRQYLENTCKLPDLSDVTVIINYIPDNPSDDEYFEVISSIYQELLETQGATVIFVR